MAFISETQAPLSEIEPVAPPRSAEEQRAELMSERERERKQLARDLHDELGPHLTAFRYVLARLEGWLPHADPACAAALAATHQAYDALCEAGRKVVTDLHAPGIEAGLVPALAQWLTDFSARTGLVTSVVCAADPRLTQLSAAAASALLRISQEAVNNAARHGRASRVDVHLAVRAGHLVLVVTDNGAGFIATARVRAGHFGLAGMRERCRDFGGTLKISSRRDLATTVTARLPWHALLRTAATP